MQRYVFIPENLDIDEILAQSPPSITNFRKGKLLLFINLIYQQRAYTQWQVYDEFVQIMSKTIREVIDDYWPYMRYLKKTGIIEQDTTFRPAKNFPEDPKSMGYRLSVKYRYVFPTIIDTTKLSKEDIPISRLQQVNHTISGMNNQFKELLKIHSK